METLKSKIGVLLTGVAFGVLLVFGFKCNESTYNSHQSIDTVRITEIRVDTTVIEKEKIVYKNNYIPVNQPVRLDPKDTHNLAFLRVYRDSIKDSLLTIHKLDSVQGRLVSSQIKYNLKQLQINKTITNTTTITKTDTVFRPNKMALYGGLQLGGNKTSLSAITPYISFNWKNKSYTGGYNLIDNTYQVGVGIRFFSK